MCWQAGVSRAGYYRNLVKRHPDEEEVEVRAAMQEIALAHHRRYGYRRVAAELRRQGLQVNHKRVVRLMREDNLLAIRHRRFVITTDSKHDLEVYLNLAKRMKLTAVNQLWIADLTYIRLNREFVYLAVILDKWSRRVVGFGPNTGSAPGRHGAAKGDCGTSAEAGTGASLRSGHSIRFCGLCRGVESTPHDTKHEPAGESLRQRHL
jgi:transposase InsO family protein